MPAPYPAYGIAGWLAGTASAGLNPMPSSRNRASAGDFASSPRTSSRPASARISVTRPPAKSSCTIRAVSSPTRSIGMTMVPETVSSTGATRSAPAGSSISLSIRSGFPATAACEALPSCRQIGRSPIRNRRSVPAGVATRISRPRNSSDARVRRCRSVPSFASSAARCRRSKSGGTSIGRPSVAVVMPVQWKWTARPLPASSHFPSSAASEAGTVVSGASGRYR